MGKTMAEIKAERKRAEAAAAMGSVVDDVPSSAHPARTLRGALEDARRHARQDLDHTVDPRERAFLETAAEVLDGLAKACPNAPAKAHSPPG